MQWDQRFLWLRRLSPIFIADGGLGRAHGPVSPRCGVAAGSCSPTNADRIISIRRSTPLPGRASFNLDSWAQGRARFDALLDAAADADLCLAEGVMGLFDGVATPGALGNGSTADIAAATGGPRGVGGGA